MGIRIMVVHESLTLAAVDRNHHPQPKFDFFQILLYNITVKRKGEENPTHSLITTGSDVYDLLNKIFLGGQSSPLVNDLRRRVVK